MVHADPISAVMGVATICAILSTPSPAIRNALARGTQTFLYAILFNQHLVIYAHYFYNECVYLVFLSLFHIGKFKPLRGSVRIPINRFVDLISHWNVSILNCARFTRNGRICLSGH